MSASGAQRPDDGARAGGRFLTLLADPLNVAALRALEETPALSTAELNRAAGSPAQTTLRGRLRELIGLGLLERQHRARSTDSHRIELTTAGFEFLEDAEAVEAWLAERAEQPVELGTMPARNALKILVEGWSSTLVHALAAEPLSVTQLAEAIDLNYPALERRVRGMRSIGLLAPLPGDGRVHPCEPTEWLRRAAGPLAVAARWEQVNSIPGSRPPSEIDMKAVLLLAAPLLRLPHGRSGSCRLTVEEEAGHGGSSVAFEARRGRIAHSTLQPEGDVDASASGLAAEWFWAVAEDDPGQLEIGGDAPLARAAIAGMHSLLFG